MSRSLPSVATLLLVILATPIFVALAASEGEAQTREKRDGRTLLQRLFGVPPRVEAPRQKPKEVERPRPSKKKATKPKKKKKATKPRKKKRSTEPPVPVIQPKPKSPDALKIVVIGDEVAGATAWGLEQVLAEEPLLKVVDASDLKVGLTAGKGFDGSSRLPAILNKTQPHFVVLAFGVNDRQPIGDSPIRSEAWRVQYEQRISGLAETLRVYSRPFFWISAPPLRSKAAMKDMAYVNGLYRPQVERAGGHFIDLWEGFVSPSGRYVSSGPDAEGQTRQLRTGDGINFTKAGKLKLAFYVEREIRRIAGPGRAGVDLAAHLTPETRVEVTKDGRKILVGPVLSLNDPVIAATIELAGSGTPFEPKPDSVQYKAIVLGESLPLVPGRVDDFSWKGPSFAQGKVAPQTSYPSASATEQHVELAP